MAATKPTETTTATDKPSAPATLQPDAPSDQAATVVTTDALDDPKKVDSYVVAPGRTVIGDEKKSYGPGDKVKLPAADASRLIDAGFLLAPDGSIVVHADGPAVNVENGVQIAQPAS